MFFLKGVWGFGEFTLPGGRASGSVLGGSLALVTPNMYF